MSGTNEDFRQFTCIISMEKASPFILYLFGPMIQHFKHWNVVSVVVIGAAVGHTTPISHIARKNIRMN